MSAPGSPSANPHLRAAASAFGILGLLLLVSFPLFAWSVQRRLPDLIEAPLQLKNQGEWLQRAAFGQKDVLPVYGSSEMTVVSDGRPDEFFHSKPTGFRVCPVGAAGSTSFLIAQKIASIADAARGRKLAIILSATWFCRPGVPDDSYAGNFSPLQAGSILLHDELDAGLRQRYVARMLEFPESLPPHPPLGVYLRQTGAEGKWPAAMCAMVRPLLWASRFELNWEDRFATSWAALNFANVKPPHSEAVVSGADISRMIADLERADGPEPVRELKNKDNEGDAEFLAAMNASKEWDDLALLLDTMKFLKMQVLVLSVPLPAWHFDRHAVSRDAMDGYYRRLEATCRARGFACVDFPDHEWDENFTLPNTSHFSEKGWLYVDRVLDDFYHDRLAAPEPAGKAP